MWWIIIVAIIVIILIKFISDSNRQAKVVIKQGGMRVKYKTLVMYFLQSSPNAQIVQENSTFINVGIVSSGYKMAFFITQTYGTVTIEWKMESQILGKHRLEWQFDEFMDQEKMIEKIENDLEIYQNNMIQKYM